MREYPFKKLWKRLGVTVLDLVGNLFVVPFKFFRKPFDISRVKRILVVRLDQIGDVVMTRPAFRALRKKFPQAAIDLLVSEETAPLLKSCSEFSSILVAKHSWLSRKSGFLQKFLEFFRLCVLLFRNHYDLGIDFRGDLRNILLLSLSGIRYRIGYGITGGGFLLTQEIHYDITQHQVRLNLDLLKSFHITYDSKLLPFEHHSQRAQQFWKKTGGQPPATLLPRVIIHIDSGYPSKRWPFENFRSLIQRINQTALAQIILVGTTTDKEKTPELSIPSERFIDLRGKTSLEELPVLFDVCDMFIGNDSGPAHIAAAQGLEILLIASGTNDIRYWHPWTERLSLVHHSAPCSPCQMPICPLPEHPCMKEISVEQAFDAFQSVLERLKKRS